MDTHDVDQDYNRYIAQRLGLDESFDFMNDSEAIRKAEEKIRKINLESNYLQELNEINTEKTPINILKPYIKALAIVKALGKK